VTDGEDDHFTVNSADLLTKFFFSAHVSCRKSVRRFVYLSTLRASSFFSSSGRALY
jgi:hypothetical protein